MAKIFEQRDKLTFFNYFSPSFPFIEADSNYQNGHLTVLSQAQDPCPRKPQWLTEDGYKLTKPTLWRRFTSPDELVGINFNTTTTRGMVDLDFPTSKYHYAVNSEAYQKVLDVLEDIGITRTVPIRSSHSGGLNIYFAFPKAINTFALSCLLQIAFESAGFEIKPGQLEIFPNCKYYGSSYKSHCVPFQDGRGSLLLGDDLEPISDRLEDFLARMEWSAKGQDTKQVKAEAKIARQIITVRRQIKYKSSSKAMEKLIVWQKDWEAIIGEGWLDTGESNYLLGIIAAYAVVFKGLEGTELIDHIVATASSAPGYRQYCNHKHEIRKRATEWARSAQRRYWQLGTERKEQRITFKEMVDTAGQPPGNATNDKRASEAQDRIQIGWNYIKKYALRIPSKLGEYRDYLIELIAKLTGKTVSNNTLTKYPALWHPKHNEEIKKYFDNQKDLTDLESSIKEDRENIEQPEPDCSTNQTEPEVNISTLENPQATDIPSFDHTKSAQKLTENSETTDIPSFDHTPSYMKVRGSQIEVSVNYLSNTFNQHEGNNPTPNPKKNKNLEKSEEPKKTELELSKSELTFNIDPNISIANGSTDDANPAHGNKQDLSVEYYQNLLIRHNETWGSFASEKSNPEYQKSAKRSFAQIRKILNQKNQKPKET